METNINSRHSGPPHCDCNLQSPAKAEQRTVLIELAAQNMTAIYTIPLDTAHRRAH